MFLAAFIPVFDEIYITVVFGEFVVNFLELLLLLVGHLKLCINKVFCYIAKVVHDERSILIGCQGNILIGSQESNLIDSFSGPMDSSLTALQAACFGF